MKGAKRSDCIVGYFDGNEKFKLLSTPVGKVMINKVTVEDMSKKSGMPEAELIERLIKLIESHR